MRYLGRELPTELAAVRTRRDQLKPAMASRERELRAQAAALLRQAETLERIYRDLVPRSGDEEIIVELGFADALVSAGALTTTQACTLRRWRVGTS